MEFIKITKRMKKLFTITTKGNVSMAIEWNVIDDIVNVNWCTVNGKLYNNNLPDSIKDKFIEKTLMYAIKRVSDFYHHRSPLLKRFGTLHVAQRGV